MQERPLSRRAARRIARAEETRRKALSPARILLRIAGIPLLTCAIAVSVYLRTSDYPREDAMRHLWALGGCDMALSVGLAPAYQEGLGYHARNDPDGDGIACDHLQSSVTVLGPSEPAQTAPVTPPGRMSEGGAKFLRP